MDVWVVVCTYIITRESQLTLIILEVANYVDYDVVELDQMFFKRSISASLLFIFQSSSNALVMLIALPKESKDIMWIVEGKKR